MTGAVKHAPLLSSPAVVARASGPTRKATICKPGASWAPTLTLRISTPRDRRLRSAAPHSPASPNGGARNAPRRRRRRRRFRAPETAPPRRAFARGRLRPRGRSPRLRKAAPSGSGARLSLRHPLWSSEAAVPPCGAGRHRRLGFRFRWVSGRLACHCQLAARRRT